MGIIFYPASFNGEAVAKLDLVTFCSLYDLLVAMS